jgi:hypothetical protein
MRMRISCWIPKAKDTHSEYIILIGFFTATTVARTRPGVTFTYIAGLVRADTNICVMNMFMIRDGIKLRLRPGRSQAGNPIGTRDYFLF